MPSGKKIFTNIIWRFFERTGTQLVTLAVSIILARMLAPELFGLLAMIVAVVTVLRVPIENCLGHALIQKEDADRSDFSTAFYFNLIVAAGLYAAVFFIAPAVAAHAEVTGMTALIRVLGVSIPVSAFKSLQQAYAERNMLFRKFFFASLAGTVIAGVAGVLLALKGFGIWALAAQYMLDLTVDTVLLWVIVRWRPNAVFSSKRLGALLSYGWKLTASALMDSAFEGLKQTLTGLRISSADLAYLNRGQVYPRALFNTVNSSVENVMFSAMSREQSRPEIVREMVRKNVTTVTYVLAPFLAGLAAVAEPLTRLVLTEKWMPCVPLLRICCAAYLLSPAVKANQSAINAMGRSGLFLILEVIKKLFSVTILFISLRFGVTGVACGMLVISLICLIVNAVPNGRLVGYPLWTQLLDVLPSVALAAAMGIAVYAAGHLGLGDAVTLAIQIPLGIILYLAGSAVLKLKGCSNLIGLIRSLKKK